MKKRVLALLLVAIMLLTLGGCGKISNDKISIKKYKGLEVTEVAPIKVTDKDVEASIESTLQMMADEIEVTDRAAKEGDTVTIDYLGTYEGERFDSNEGWVLELGSKTTVDGFEEGIMGHNKGETFDMKVTFPKGYGAKTESGVELSEKEVDFKITIQKIVTYDVPELT